MRNKWNFFFEKRGGGVLQRKKLKYFFLGNEESLTKSKVEIYRKSIKSVDDHRVVPIHLKKGFFELGLDLMKIYTIYFPKSNASRVLSYDKKRQNSQNSQKRNPFLTCQSLKKTERSSFFKADVKSPFLKPYKT